MRYDSVQHALDTCAKFQANVCTTENWMLLVELTNCFICALEEPSNSWTGDNSTPYIELDKFIICTNNSEHEFTTDTAVKPMSLDLSTSIKYRVLTKH
jgi:hypothetical protein